MPRFSLAAFLALAAACGSGSDTPDDGAASTAAPAAAAASCDLLTAADIQEVTGTAVERIDRNPSIGAGGTCANFALDGQAWLGVNRLGGEGEYARSIAAVPEDLYPRRDPVAGRPSDQASATVMAAARKPRHP